MATFTPYILQWLLAKRVVFEREAVGAVEGLLEPLNAPQDVSLLLSSLRETLLSYHLDIKRIHFDDDEEYQWVLHNTSEDPISQLATSCSSEELACFKELLRFISTASNYQASPLEALIQASGPLGKKHCEDLMDRLVSDKWLQKSSGGKLMAGPRTIVELEAYLREEGLFEGCAICNTLVASKCIRCGSPECKEVVLHRGCLQRMAIAGQRYQCSGCGQEIASPSGSIGGC